MRLEEVFEFDEAEYAKRVGSYTTAHLKEQERIKVRQSYKAVAGAAAGGVATVLTGGATFLHPAYAIRQGDVAEKKLDLIRAELTKRGVQHHKPDGDDEDAALLGALGGSLAVEGMDGITGDHGIAEGEVEQVVTSMLANEVAQQAVAEVTDAPPPPGCRRLNVKKYTPLICSECRKKFDTSFTQYLRK